MTYGAVVQDSLGGNSYTTLVATVNPREVDAAHPPHPAPCTLHPAPDTPHPTPCTLHPTPRTLHPAPYTLHPSSFNLHPRPYTLHSQSQFLHCHVPPHNIFPLFPTHTTR